MALIEGIKEAVKLARKIDNIELYRALMDSQTDALDLMDQLREKESRIEQLEKALALKGELIALGSCYYLSDDSGRPKDGPFCTKCFDVDHVMCRIVTKGQTVACQTCDRGFYDKTAHGFLFTIERRPRRISE